MITSDGAMAYNFDWNLNKNIIKPSDCHVGGSGLFAGFAQSKDIKDIKEIVHFLYSIYLAIYCLIFIFNIKKIELNFF